VDSQLYNFMMLGIIMIMLLDFIVSISLYKYFKNDNNKLALWTGFLRIKTIAKLPDSNFS